MEKFAMDIDTLLLLGVLLTFSTALILGYASWSLSVNLGPARRSMQIWLGAILIQCLFWILFVFGRELGVTFSVVLVNCLSVLAMAEYNRSIRVFLGLTEQRRILYSVVAVVALLIIYFGIFNPNYLMRVLSVSLPGAVLMAWLSYVAITHCKSNYSRASLVVAIVFGIGAVSLLARAADALFRPELEINESLPQQAALLVYAIVPVFASIGFLLMQTHRAYARLEQLAAVDYLTGTLNRRSFQDVANKALAGCKRTDRNASILLIDIDHFKIINDSYGHAAGDQAICRLCSIMAEALRAEDIIARMGGEEFVILLPGARLEEASQVAERLRKAIAETPIEFDAHRFFMTASVGVAQWQDQDLELIIKQADNAMYAAKNNGRNRVELAESRKQTSSETTRPTRSEMETQS
jgi:diguanylate cyclase (GGDEF)-like protein